MNFKTLPNMLQATVLGAVAMYICDPVVGRRRRALARDKMYRLRKATQEAARITIRDLKNRTWGIAAEGRAALFGDRVDDAVLAERVRSKLGFMVRHPSSIDVQARQGTVTLTGAVLTDEVQQLVDGVRSVRGVRDVENVLAVHQAGDNIPRLQGDVAKPGGQLLDVFQRRWSPSTRFLLGTAGMAVLFGLKPFRRAVAGLPMLTGLGLLACGVAEDEWRNRKRSEPRNDEIG